MNFGRNTDPTRSYLYYRLYMFYGKTLFSTVFFSHFDDFFFKIDSDAINNLVVDADAVNVFC